MSLRTRHRALALIAASATFLTGLALATPAQAAQTPKGTVVKDSLFGMHVYNAEFGEWPSIGFGTLRLWDNRTSWANIERTQGVFDWTALDTAVATSQAKGVDDILMVLAGTPTWATDDPSPTALPQPGAAGMPRNIAWWDNWVTQVATRYKGKITAYQPWNEANLATFSTGSAQDMADLTKHAYDIIKRIDPNATVVAPSTGTRLGGPFKSFYPKYLAALKAYGWPVDVWAAHTYPASLGTPVDRTALAKLWQNALAAAGAPKKPMWDTENNFGLKGPGPQNPDVDLEGTKAADWVARTYLDALRLNISRVYWYRWEPYNDLWGIQMYNGTPGAASYQTLQKWIVGATFNGCPTKGTNVTCNFTKGGKKFQIVYTDSGASRNIKLNASYSQVCSLDGSCKSLGAKSVTTAGPVLVTNS